jgi:hypothetical protein
MIRRANSIAFALAVLLLLGAVLKTSKPILTAGHIKGRREAISQSVVLLILVDQPQRHSSLVRVNI